MAPKGKKHCVRTLPPDVLNNLPENVVDEILIRLPLRDAVRTSILAKKWRYNWCRLPQLALDQALWKTKKDLTYITSNFTKIIYHILTLHVGPITKFTLCIPGLEGCPNLDNLMYFLSRNVIQHLVLRLPRGNQYKLPSSFFGCLQLRHLTLKNCLILPPPTFKGFDRLTSLKLYNVSISSKLLESLISHSPLLEQLVLQISGLSDIIEINAPMLRSFDFTGNIRCICFKSIPLLAKLLLTQENYVEEKCNIAKFFEPLIALEHLHLNDTFFFAGAGEVPTRLPFNLNFVKHLCISSICLFVLEEVSCALCLLRSFPCLQYVEIKVEAGDGNDIPALECLEVEQFSDVSFNHLREVKLIRTNGTIREMQLMKLLLAKSPVLVRMLIQPCLVEDSGTVILAELTNFQRASPKAQVVYKHQ
ncbi:PREDICTED: F-box/FBD/LRR-repeat protein At1g13570-like [Nicotiana attenuata]|uniref:F-box/FBD/LRR-repeat protein At1g13570-like n=1 Tax=Nicotiana attenuata TaxID=49451 RepID=UPI000905CBB5|nr:PREDICTED: F-box/FBD/LRR-repeat protein At1g13570-like [Nicotiana attenuata]